MSFEQQLADEDRAVVVEEGVAADVTLVAFGGLLGGSGIPPYEFFRVTQDLPVRRVFVRDLRQLWYLGDVPGLGANVLECATTLRALLDEHDTVRVVTTGNSAGGFGAILFGGLLGADAVVAFSPQTVVDARGRAMLRDYRWRAQMRRIRVLPDPERGHQDLRRLLQDLAQRPAIEVHFGTGDRLDARHARHIDGSPDVTLYPHGGHGHDLVARLRDSGELHGILAGAVTPRRSRR